MFRAESALAPTSPHAAHNISDSTIAQLLRRRISTLNPVESALPQNQISHFANPIESTPFFQIAPFRTNSAPVTPAYTTLTKHIPRNPIRMNTSAKHQGAPLLAGRLTILYSTCCTDTGSALAHQQRDCSHTSHALSSSVRRRNSCPSEISPQASCSSQHLSSPSICQTLPRKPRHLHNSIPLSTPTSAGAASAPSAADAPWPSPASRNNPASFTWPRSTAASGKPTTLATPGIPSLTINPPGASAPSPSRPAIPTSSTWAAAKVCNARISPSATACTSPPTPENPGRISACATRNKSPRSSSIRIIPNASSSPSKAIPTAPTPNATKRRLGLSGS